MRIKPGEGLLVALLQYPEVQYLTFARFPDFIQKAANRDGD
jgi:hypothetical protein